MVESPVYRVQVTHHGQPFMADVQAMKLLGENWAIGYITPTGRHKKLTVKGNEHTLKSEEACITRLKQLAAYRGWRKKEG